MGYVNFVPYHAHCQARVVSLGDGGEVCAGLVREETSCTSCSYPRNFWL